MNLRSVQHLGPLCAVIGILACSRVTPAEPATGKTNAAPVVAAAAVEPGVWTDDLDAALALGRKEKLPVFLNFTGSDWCPVCITTDRQIFSTPEWQDFARTNLVLVTLDFPNNMAGMSMATRMRNESLHGQLGVTGFPTFFIVDAAENAVIARLGAYRGMVTGDLLRDVRWAMRPMAGVVARAEARLEPGVVPIYRDILASLRTAQDELDGWLKTEPVRNDDNLKRYRESMRKIEALQAEADRIEGWVDVPPTLLGLEGESTNSPAE